MSAVGKKVACETVKRAKLAEILRRDYVQTILMVAIILVSVVVFWYGLRAFFRTENPLLAVASGSMKPVLYKGDLILVKGVQNACEIHAAPKDANPPGDIIVFRKPGGAGGWRWWWWEGDLIVHRAIRKINSTDGSCSFKTQGDANLIPDWWEVGESDIVGKYTGAKMPLLGHIALFFEPFEVKVAFIILLIVILILLEFVPLARKEIKEGKSETKVL